MSIDAPPRRQGGLSLVELLMFMVIVSIAVMGVLQVMRLTTRASADPLARKQALLIAESLLEEVELAHFTYCEADDDAAPTAAGTADCTAVEDVGPAPLEGRPFDNVNDYVTVFGAEQAAFNSAGVLADVNLAPIAAANGYTYTATLRIAPEALGGIASAAAPAAMEVLRITVTVRYGNDSVVLDGYRTRYAPNTI
jgi:MSHA pilin protein MshD